MGTDPVLDREQADTLKLNVLTFIPRWPETRDKAENILVGFYLNTFYAQNKKRKKLLKRNDITQCETLVQIPVPNHRPYKREQILYVQKQHGM